MTALHTLKDHAKSALSGIGDCGALAFVAGLACFGIGAMGGAAATAALAAPLLIGGGCIWGAARICSLVTVGVRTPSDPMKLPTRMLAMAAAAYVMLAHFPPTQNSLPYRNEVFGRNGAITQKFNSAVRSINRHVIWPSIDLTHKHAPKP